jgi:hypothetical protein
VAAVGVEHRLDERRIGDDHHRVCPFINFLIYFYIIK